MSHSDKFSQFKCHLMPFYLAISFDFSLKFLCSIKGHRLCAHIKNWKQNYSCNLENDSKIHSIKKSIKKVQFYFCPIQFDTCTKSLLIRVRKLFSLDDLAQDHKKNLLLHATLIDLIVEWQQQKKNLNSVKANRIT